jgi:hypothetical protein
MKRPFGIRASVAIATDEPHVKVTWRVTALTEEGR